MRNKKSENMPESGESALEQHVKEMMDPSVPDPQQVIPVPDDKPEIDIFQEAPGPGTAPEIKGEKVPSEPVEEDQSNGAEESEVKDAEIEVTEDQVVDDAVDDIVAHESDELLAAEDKELAKAFEAEKKPTITAKIKNLLEAWWNNKKARWGTLAVLVLALIVAMAVPVSRYFVLNNVGVRASASIAVFDKSTGQPLKNVKVILSGQSGSTDVDGKVKLDHLKLGSQEIAIEKRAFAPEKHQVTVGWGSNPLGDINLQPIGSQFAFVVTDFLSGKPVSRVEASSGEASALSDDKGQIKLTVDKTDETDLIVTINGKGYRQEQVSVPFASKEELPVKLVSERKEVFISKRSGKFDLYSIDIDGKNEKLVLAGTGSEREDMALVPHPTRELVAFVSTRDNKHNSDGFLLSTLTLVDLEDNSSEPIAQSESIRVVGWNNDRLVYVQIAAGPSAANPRRYRLMSYNTESGVNQEIASSDYFNDVTMAGGKIYYAPSGAGFYAVNTDGTSKQNILNKETWNIFRTAYDKLVLSVGSDWYEYRPGDKQVSKLNGQPANLAARLYIDSPNGEQSLWVDNRDGKGVLIVYDTSGKEDKVLQAKSGISNPVRWLSDSSIIFRVKTDQETADYAMDLAGGNPVKIKDVTNVPGLVSWYGY